METRSKNRIEELRKRVSFEVHQETEEDKIWNVMKGGKDDMYIYDRCGRLAFFVPFPLSIIRPEKPIIMSALVTTYFNNPCGDNCSENVTISTEVITETQTTTLFNTEFPSIVNEVEIGDEETAAGNISFTANDDYLDEIFNNTFYMKNTSVTETDSLFANITSENITIGSTSDFKNTSESKQGLINSLFNFFWKAKTTEIPVTETTPVDINNNLPNSSFNQSDENNDIQKAEKSRNKCFGAEANVCKDWSKQRMLKARECCSAIGKENTEPHHEHAQCRRYNRRKCKKLQTLLKCCLRTEVADETVTTEVIPNPETKSSK